MPAWLPSFNSTIVSLSVIQFQYFQPLHNIFFVNRIQELEYIEMAGLVPEAGISRRRSKVDAAIRYEGCIEKGPCTNILLWVECCSSLVAVMATKYPAAISELMAYQQTIIKESKLFAGEGWVTYDTCYRRKARVTKSLR